MGNCLKGKKEEEKNRIIIPNINVPEDILSIDHPNAKFARNHVRTTKYTLWTFLFLNLYEQFHRFANVYFVFILILNFMPEVSAFAKEVAPLPVIFVLSVTATKDAFEDYRRWKSDKKVNNAQCHIYDRHKRDYVDKKWSDLRVGDFVQLKCNEVIPADVLVLRSSDACGVCHIETANLDGESNLKQRHVVKGFSNGEFDPENFKYEIEVEPPNNELNKFNGRLNQGLHVTHLLKDNVLLRGCMLRNTDFVEGIVIYAGSETKAMQNNSGARFKRSKLERQINKDVIWCVIILIILCVTGALGNGIWLQSFPQRDKVIYLSLEQGYKSEPAYQAFINFWTFIIIFQAMIPLPLYVSIELIKVGQVFFIINDIELYDPDSDRPMEVKAMNITEDLGQIQYIFSDKTGTLTENKMEFRRCSIGGVDYEHESNSKTSLTDSMAPILPNETTETGLDDEKMSSHLVAGPSEDCLPLSRLEEKLSQPYFSLRPQDAELVPPDVRTAQEFFFLLAICNTVVVSINKNDTTPSEPLLRKPKKRRFKGRKDTVDDREGGKKKRKKGQKLQTPDTVMALVSGVNKVIDMAPDPHYQRHLQLPPIRNAASVDNLPDAVDGKAGLSGTDITSSLSLDPLSNLPALNMARQLLQPAFGDNISDNGTVVSEATSIGVSPFSTAMLLESYEAESPDEMALVKTACHYGWKLCQRGPEFVSVWVPGDGLQTLRVLHVLPFDSDRKCMSILVRHPITNHVMLYCKGADSAIFNLLQPSGSDEKLFVKTQDHMNQYARAGLRTLVLGKREIPEDEYNMWLREYRAAEGSFLDREQKLSLAFKKIEKDLILLGATGIEDQLQDGVPDTICSLREAGINVWVLTGDKLETAINIAYSAKLISERQTLITLTATSMHQAADMIATYLREIEISYPQQVEFRQRRKRPRARPELALCVDGDTLRFALQEELQPDFLMLAEQCRSVICARTTPHQKASVVRLVKENLHMQTLAIGDGANDVNMIQTADIGIGISGQEGMQAVMASDFAIARFKFLKRLLLVHGHWCYERLANVALHLFYKDAIFILLLFWFQLFNGFSGSSMMDQLYQMLFNLTMTSLPPIIVGLFDRNINASTLMANPVLYRDGQMCITYLPWHFWMNIADAVWQSLAIFFVPYLIYADSDVGLWFFGTLITCTGVLVTIIVCGIETRSWTGFHWFACIGSFSVAFVGFALIYNAICDACPFLENPYFVMMRCMMDPVFWLVVLLSTVVAVMPRIAVNAMINTLYPSLNVKARQFEKRLGKGKPLPLEPKQNVFSIYDQRGSLNNQRNVRRVRPMSAPLRTQSLSNGGVNPAPPPRRHRRAKSSGDALREAMAAAAATNQNATGGEEAAATSGKAPGVAGPSSSTRTSPMRVHSRKTESHL